MCSLKDSRFEPALKNVIFHSRNWRFCCYCCCCFFYFCFIKFMVWKWNISWRPGSWKAWLRGGDARRWLNHESPDLIHEFKVIWAHRRYSWHVRCSWRSLGNTFPYALSCAFLCFLAARNLTLLHTFTMMSPFHHKNKSSNAIEQGCDTFKTIGQNASSVLEADVRWVFLSHQQADYHIRSAETSLKKVTIYSL